MHGMTISGKLFADELTEWLLEAGLSNINVRYLYITSMNHMDQKLLSYVMLMTMSIGILLRLLEYGLWVL